MDYSSAATACKYQDCKAKHEGVINVINTLTASVKKMTSMRGVILSNRISYPYTPLEIKVARGEGKIFPGHHQVSIKAKLQSLCLCLAPLFNGQGPQKRSMRYCQQQSEVSRNEKCLINIIKGFSILAGLPWHLIDEVYILINYGDGFPWVLAGVILKERRILVYESMSRRRHFGPSSKIQKIAKILLTYLDISGFLDQKICCVIPLDFGNGDLKSQHDAPPSRCPIEIPFWPSARCDTTALDYWNSIIIKIVLFMMRQYRGRPLKIDKWEFGPRCDMVTTQLACCQLKNALTSSPSVGFGKIWYRWKAYSISHTMKS
ncbi:hypothetical protein BC332_18195 [Capsicum chinense]|nr:hypothetical protein BC332_18195 [Capsicum chinense]